jgi:ubiquinone/menaquinone biosynthesis C-methylase UbiE
VSREPGACYSARIVAPTPTDYDRDFAAVVNSATYRRIGREASGDNYPDGADPFSFTTRSELDLIAGTIEVGSGQTLVDIACGQGGPGLWVARSTGADLIGVDFSPVGVAQAESRALAMGLSNRARFIVADAAATGLPSGQIGAAMSIDALQLMPDSAAVLAEVRRILRPNARFALTTWEPTESDQGAPENPNNKPLRTLLEGASFRVVRYETTPAWRRLGKALYEGWLREKESLIAEMGAESYAPLEREATKSLPFLDEDERVLIVSVAV